MWCYEFSEVHTFLHLTYLGEEYPRFCNAVTVYIDNRSAADGLKKLNEEMVSTVQVFSCRKLIWEISWLLKCRIWHFEIHLYLLRHCWLYYRKPLGRIWSTCGSSWSSPSSWVEQCQQCCSDSWKRWCACGLIGSVSPVSTRVRSTILRQPGFDVDGRRSRCGTAWLSAAQQWMLSTTGNDRWSSSCQFDCQFRQLVSRR